MTSTMSSMKHEEQDNAVQGGSTYTSDSLDSETDAPFRIIDPASIMEDDFYEEDEDYEEEEYDEEELLHIAETRPIISQTSHQQPQNQQSLQQPPQEQKPHKRKQQIQHLNRDEEQINLLTRQEYSALEKQSKEIIRKPSTAKDKLYMLNPEDFKNDRFKQQQIRRAKVTHNHHRRKNHHIQRLQGENAKLKDLVTFYEQREKRIRQHCHCDGVLKLLSKRPTLNETIDDEEEEKTIISTIITKPESESIGQTTATVPPVIELKKPSSFSSQPINKEEEKGDNNNKGVSSHQQSSTIVPVPALINSASSLVLFSKRKAIHSPTTISNNVTPPRQSIMSRVEQQQQATTTSNTSRPPPPLVPSPLKKLETRFTTPPRSSSNFQGPSTSSKIIPNNILMAQRGINGTRLVQVPVSALSSFTGIFGSSNTLSKRKQVHVTASTHSHTKVDNTGTTTAVPLSRPSPIISVKRKINPMSHLQNTLKAINTIVHKRQVLSSSSNSSSSNQPLKTPLDKVFGTEINEEILRYWSDEVIPLPPRIITTASNSSRMPTNSPPSPVRIDNVNQDEESSFQRRSKRSAATSRLSTAELLGVVNKSQKLSNKVSPAASEQVVMSCTEEQTGEVDYSNIDWDTFEVQYLQPRQMY